MPRLDLTQAIFAISMASGRGENAWGTHAEILDYMEKALTGGGTWIGEHGSKDDKVRGTWQITGFFDTFMADEGWRVVWGPAVYVHGIERCLANGMFVAYNEIAKTYVVAVAGTNFISDFAILQEDFNLSKEKMVDFPIDPATPIESQFKHADFNKAQLGTGTAIGLHVLLTQMRDRYGHDLITFLNVQPAEPATKLVFAGHSLGGALAPALALQLWDRLAPRWNKENVMILPTAGATPGNGKFRDAWLLKFPRKHVQMALNTNNLVYFNRLYWNNCDFVPHAWNNFKGWYRYDPIGKPNELSTNLGIYHGNDSGLKNIEYELTQANGLECGMTQLPDSSPFWGSWPVKYLDAQGVCHSYPQQTDIRSDQEMLVAKGMAHMGQYYQYAGLDPCDIPAVARLISTG